MAGIVHQLEECTTASTSLEHSPRAVGGGLPTSFSPGPLPLALNTDGGLSFSTLDTQTDISVDPSHFKRTFFSLVDRYIPSISIKSDFTYPWFDAECFEVYRDKERAHKNSKIILGLKEILRIFSKVKQILSIRDSCSKMCNKKREITFIMKMILG